MCTRMGIFGIPSHDIFCADCVAGSISAESGTSLFSGKICPHGGNWNAALSDVSFHDANPSFEYGRYILHFSNHTLKSGGIVKIIRK